MGHFLIDFLAYLQNFLFKQMPTNSLAGQLWNEGAVARETPHSLQWFDSLPTSTEVLGAPPLH